MEERLQEEKRLTRLKAQAQFKPTNEKLTEGGDSTSLVDDQVQ
jgi:hypothetical protein